MCFDPAALAVLACCFLPPTPAPADPGAGAADERLLREARVAAGGPALLDFFRNQTMTEATRAKVEALVRQLGDPAFDRREKASAELVALGRVALPQLRQALRDADLEVRRRAEDGV